MKQIIYSILFTLGVIGFASQVQAFTISFGKNEIAGTDYGRGEELPGSLTQEVRNEWRDSINRFSSEIGSPLGTDYGEYWVETGIAHGVHPYFLVSIALADSSLGKNLTTPFNIGNNNNTDSCPTCQSYDNWESGIWAMAQTTTNGYLGYKQNICEFSRGGSCWSGSYYASSWFNWNTNVKNTFAKLSGLSAVDTHCIRLSCYFEEF